MKSTIGRAILQIIACANPAAAVTCPAAAAGLTLAAGGSIKQALLAAVISFGQMQAYDFIGGFVQGLEITQGPIVAGATKLATHAVVGGAFSVAQGGSFEAGALSGLVSAGASLASGAVLGAPGGGTDVAQVAIAAVAGGTASVLAGGKFANGAITAAMALLYNEAHHTVTKQVAAKAIVATAVAAEIADGNPIAIGMAATAAAVGTVYTVTTSAVDIYDAVTRSYSNDNAYVHGNSEFSNRVTHVYEIVDGSQEVQKYGITSRHVSRQRYSEGFYKSTGYEMNVIATHRYRYLARAHELTLCGSFVAANGRLPSMSVRC